MKKLIKKLNVRLFIVVAALAFITTVDAGAHGFRFFAPRHQCKTVGAPLDGGLLTVLLGAGALFFVTRKKEKE